MNKKEIIESISNKGNGEIYLGVVGSVRSGKSTFIKRFIETLVVPNIEDEYDKKRCLDEIPQTAQGKTIMTIEPKFVPSSGANIKIDGFQTNIKLVDCVGYIIDKAQGYTLTDGSPRMIKTPWVKLNK
jgi:stage IV sporulation protein A